jgi:Cdc6-like AAA superfamily ATPase
MQPNPQKMFEVGAVFTPSSPVDSKDLFAGRNQQIRTVISAIVQTGQHAVIYGERGVGKTSLANVISGFLPSDRSMGIITVRVNCDVGTTYKRLFKSILEEINVVYSRPGIGFSNEDKIQIERLSESIVEKSIDPNQLRFLFRDLKNKMIIIIDELKNLSQIQ